MEEPPVMPKPCCVCDGPGGKHCTKCKSRHYCSKKCQLVDWHEGGHKAQCKQLAADFQDRLLDELMPANKVKEEPAIVEDVAPADGSKARLSAVRAAKTAEAGALSDDAPSWRGTCAICLDMLPIEGMKQTFYECCCKSICKDCHVKCIQHDARCPLCRGPPSKSADDWLRRMQKHVGKGNAEAQIMLGGMYRDGGMGLQQNFKRAVQLFEHAAAQGHAPAQTELGCSYEAGEGIKIDFKTAVHWYRRAAEQEHPGAQTNLGLMYYNGKGVAQSYDEAVKWLRLAAAQGDEDALYNLGACYANGHGVPQDLDEAMRLFKRAAAKGFAKAAAAVEQLKEQVAAARSGRPT